MRRRASRRVVDESKSVPGGDTDAIEDGSHAVVESLGRGSKRVRFHLEIAAPVWVRSDECVQRGLARNISEGGMLIELGSLPPIGARLEISFAGVHGSSDAPEPVILLGEVRHQLSWQYGPSDHKRTMRGVGVRFLELEENSAPLTAWFWSTGRTMH